MTGGGITYSPDNKEELVRALNKMFGDANLRASLGDSGRKGVRTNLSLERMSVGLSEIYSKLDH